MTKRAWLMAALIVAGSTATQAQAQTGPSTATAIDPARLTAARAVIDRIFPPATREQIVQGMMTAMAANIRQSLTQNPQFAAAMGSDKRVQSLMDAFMDRQAAQTSALVKTNLPGMADAMARAYARRFDVRQLGELAAFFATPTGQVYTQASMTIMSDPDVAAWQRNLMTQSLGHVQQDVAEFARQVAALQPHGTTP